MTLEIHKYDKLQLNTPYYTVYPKISYITTISTVDDEYYNCTDHWSSNIHQKLSNNEKFHIDEFETATNYALPYLMTIEELEAQYPELFL